MPSKLTVLMEITKGDDGKWTTAGGVMTDGPGMTDVDAGRALGIAVMASKKMADKAVEACRRERGLAAAIAMQRGVVQGVDERHVGNVRDEGVRDGERRAEAMSDRRAKQPETAYRVVFPPFEVFTHRSPAFALSLSRGLRDGINKVVRETFDDPPPPSVLATVERRNAAGRWVKVVEGPGAKERG